MLYNEATVDVELREDVEETDCGCGCRRSCGGGGGGGGGGKSGLLRLRLQALVLDTPQARFAPVFKRPLFTCGTGGTGLSAMIISRSS